MTDTPLSRRQFFGATAATAVLGALPASTAEARRSPLAPEPPPPAGVCQRLGSARFRELTTNFQFSPDSKWLAQFDGGAFVGYEVASGRRVWWAAPDARARGVIDWQLANDDVFMRFADEDIDGRPPHLYDLESGRRRKVPKFTQTTHSGITPDAAGLIQYDEKQLWRTDLRTGKRVWVRKWKSDAAVPEVAFAVTERWVVGVGAKRLHLFDPVTGNDGPRLEEARPEGAAPDNHFTPVGFSADGKRVCGHHTSEVPEGLVVWDVATGQVVGRLTPPQDGAGHALSADGQHLLTTDLNLRLVGYDVRTGKVTRHLAAKDLAEFQLSPDGQVLACFRSPQFRGFGGIDGLNNQPGGLLRLLNPATGEVLPQSPDPSADISGVRFADKHTVVAGVNTDELSQTQLVWDTRTNRRKVLAPPAYQLPFVGGFDGGFGGIAVSELSPDGTRFVTEVSGSVIVTDAVTRRRLHTFPTHDFGFGYTPFWIGRGRLGQMKAGELVWWDLVDGSRHSVTLKFPTDGLVQNTAATPDGRTVALVHWDQNEVMPTPTVAWVDMKTGDVTTHRGEIGALTISASGNRLAVTAAAEGVEESQSAVEIVVIDHGGGRAVLRLPSNTDRGITFGAELSPCGRAAFLAHTKRADNPGGLVPVVQFWEVLSGERRAEFTTPFVADGLGVSPCGRRIATTHRDAPVYLWDVFGEKTDPQAKPDATVWDALDGPTDKAFTAIRRLVQHPAAAVDLLAAKLPPAEAPKAEWVQVRIDQLGSRDFRTRHTAELDLSAVADRIVKPLRKAVAAGVDSPEADERLNRLLEQAEGMPRSAWRAVRAVEALEYCDVPEAAVLLKKLAGGVESALLTREAQAAVKRRGERPA